MLKSIAIFSLVFCLSSCAPKATSSQGSHATVTMRDGSQVSGNIQESSASEIKLTTDDHVSRTIPMAQVRSVVYDDAPAASDAASSGVPSAPSAVPSEPAHEQHYHPEAAAVTTKTYEVPSGSQIVVRNEETIDSAKAAEGQTFAAEIAKDVRDAAGDVVIPRGANTQIVIKSASAGGRFHGAADLVLDLAWVSVDGRRYQLHTADLAERGRDGVGANKRTAEFAGGGAAVGAIIGAIAGHGKGAAIGAGSGAGAGALTEVLTKGGSIRVPVESVLTFQLERPLRVAETK
jgi:hypothetical protein